MTADEKKLFEKLHEWIQNCERNTLSGMFDDEFLKHFGFHESAIDEFLESEHTGIVRSVAEICVREQLITLVEFAMIHLSEFVEKDPQANVVNEELKFQFKEYLRRQGVIV